MIFIAAYSQIVFEMRMLQDCFGTFMEGDYESRMQKLKSILFATL